MPRSIHLPISKELPIQVNLPDNSFIQLTQPEMHHLGVDVALVTNSMARLSFGTQVVYAMPKPGASTPSAGAQAVQTAAITQ